jgi:hypothetical protein
MTYHIFVGFDEREPEAYLVAKHTLEKNATASIEVHPLNHRELRNKGLFQREWKIKYNGQYEDLGDGRPFSTQFSHSRFLVPELWRRLEDPSKSPLVMFVDCDFLYLDDIKDLFDEITTKRSLTNRTPWVYCTKHDYKPENKIKMDGMEQSNYNMKLWTAMMVFDMSDDKNENLTPEMVNTETGRFLHNFGWLPATEDTEDLIVNVSERWHFVPDHSEEHTTDSPCAIHFTEGGPWFKEYLNCRYGDMWLKAYKEALVKQANG